MLGHVLYGCLQSRDVGARMIVWVVVMVCCGHYDVHSVHSTEEKADSEVLRLDAKYLYHEYIVVPLEIDGSGFMGLWVFFISL